MSKGTVAIVDDDQSFAEATTIFLEDHEFRTVPIVSGLEGLVWLERNHADLAIIDVHLPDISGIVIAEILRGEGRDIPLILTSSDDRPEVKEECCLAGARLFLSKPLAPDMLLASISEILAKRGGRDS